MDIIKTLTGLINDVDNNDIDSLKDLYLELIHLRSELQDINYTRCCELLNSKKIMKLEEWNIAKGYYCSKEQWFNKNGI